ncbi:unnamed protein product, partial [Arabidopsis halleri]
MLNSASAIVAFMRIEGEGAEERHCNLVELTSEDGLLSLSLHRIRKYS